MCPDSLPGKQQGFLLPVALFIIVIMGFAALALSRTTGQTHVAGVQELISTQALYAAESGLQAGLSELFYPDASVRTAADNRCASLDQDLSFEGLKGLNVCDASVQCTVLEPGMYQLQSQGRCGSGDIQARRNLEVQARY